MYNVFQSNSLQILARTAHPVSDASNLAHDGLQFLALGLEVKMRKGRKGSDTNVNGKAAQGRNSKADLPWDATRASPVGGICPA